MFSKCESEAFCVEFKVSLLKMYDRWGFKSKLDGVLSLYATSSLPPPPQTWWILKRRNIQHLNRLRCYNNIVQTSGKDLVSEFSDGHMLLKLYNSLIYEINSSMRLSVYNSELGVCHSKGINQHFNWIGHFTNWTNNINASRIILPL